MISKGTILTVIDNSGAKTVQCIKILNGYKKLYASIGSLITVVIKQIRRNSRRQLNFKIVKGGIYKALILRTKIYTNTFLGDSFKYIENSVILLNKSNKFLGTRIFGTVHLLFKSTKFLKVIAISSGVSF